MKKATNWLLSGIAALTFASAATAAIPKRVVIIGTLKSTVDKTATVRTATGDVKVPRDTLTVEKAQIGDTVRAHVTLAALRALNGKK